MGNQHATAGYSCGKEKMEHVLGRALIRRKDFTDKKTKHVGLNIHERIDFCFFFFSVISKLCIVKCIKISQKLE